MKSAVGLLFLTTILLHLHGMVDAIHWKERMDPIPEFCRSSQICDPDSVLTDDEIQVIEKLVEAFNESHEAPCFDKTTRKVSEPQTSLQLAVAVVEKMDLSDINSDDQVEEKAAQSFATFLHDSWGVGLPSPCGGTGILIFLSIQDRAVYISTGQAVMNVLTGTRLDRTIANMRPLLRQARYKDALGKAINDIGVHIHSGEPSFKERLFADDNLAILIFITVIIIFISMERIKQRERREYARVQSQLSELDRNRAEALQGRYRCTSCPICLEDFVEVPANADETHSDNESECASQRVGTDGLPLRLLRCGHTFDESCWNQWIATGQGNVSGCPICKQDVGRELNTEEMEESHQLNVVQLRETTEHHDIRNDHVLRQRNNANGAIHHFQSIRRYNSERAFRLLQMSQRYPRYISPQQVTVWQDPNNTGSLTQDPTFKRSNPRSESSSSTHKFGGGHSSSGRGGRW